MAVRVIPLSMSTEKIADVLGVMGENEATELHIDCADVKAEWPTAVICLAVLRPTETVPYAAMVGQAIGADGFVDYLLTSTETAIAGTIALMVTASVDGKICKSALYKSRINRALGDVGSDPETPNPDWMVTLLAGIEDAEEYKDAAEASASAAAESKTAAEGSETAAAESARLAAASAAAALESQETAEEAVAPLTQAIEDATEAAAAAQAAIAGALQKTEQTLTSGEQSQARANLGLGDAAAKGVSNTLTQTEDGYVLDARQGAALKALADGKAAPATDHPATLLATGWAGTEAPYTQAVSIADLSATAKLHVGLASTATAAQVKACAEAVLLATDQAAGSVTVGAFGAVPDADIPILIREVG